MTALEIIYILSPTPSLRGMDVPLLCQNLVFSRAGWTAVELDCEVWKASLVGLVGSGKGLCLDLHESVHPWDCYLHRNIRGQQS